MRAARRAFLFGVAVLVWLATFAGQVSADPPGSNGTVKIDGAPFDSNRNNEPHVGATFQVDFYGFDEGADLFADVIFEAHASTGSGVLLTDSVFIGEDEHGGGPAAIDAQRTYNLCAALQGFTPHPKQGFHVKLTVRADGSQGAGTKHKVFWVTGCVPATNPPPPPPPSGGTGGTNSGTPPARGTVLTGTGGPGRAAVPTTPDLPNTAVSPAEVPIQLLGLGLVLAAVSIGMSSFVARQRRAQAD